MAHNTFFPAELASLRVCIEIKNGWASWIRTSASRSQSPLPYRLAMAQRFDCMAVPTGLEPAISCVTGRHVNHYTTGPRSAGVFPCVISDPYGIRTRVTAVKGRCLNHLTNGPRIHTSEWRRRRDLNPRAVKPRPNGLANRPLQPLGYFSKEMAPQVGFEPTTYRLTAGCSTAELLRNNDEETAPKTCPVPSSTSISKEV